MTRSQAKQRGLTLKKILNEIKIKNDAIPDYDHIVLNLDHGNIQIRSSFSHRSFFEFNIPYKLEQIDTAILKNIYKLIKSYQYY